MQDGTTTVDDLVVQHAAKLKETSGGENQDKKDVKIDPPAGGAGEGGSEPIKTDPPKIDPPITNTVDDLLKELGLESLDVLKERLKEKEEKR